jgi:ATP-dependent protease ClpP protease subunit
MSKRKRCDYDSDDTENDNNELIYVEENKIMFYSDVEPKSIFKLIKAIDKAKKYCISRNNDKELPIYLHICSDGGNLYSALAVIDIILDSNIKIITICEGCVASAGVLIALAGGQRHIRKHAYMLIHEIRSGCNGKYSECKDDMINNDILMKDMKKYMNERTNNRLLKKELDKILVHDIIWDSNKCLKYGLVDKII